MSDAGLDARMLRARVQRERESLQTWERTKAPLATLPKLHRWLFMQHGAYALAERAPVVEDPGPNGLAAAQDQMLKELRDSY